jgi:hypothetical protein
VPETAGGLPAALAELPDPRARRGVRHPLPVVVSAAVCAVVAGYRSCAAIAEWIADAPDTTVVALGIAADRRLPWSPSCSDRPRCTGADLRRLY